MAALATVLLRIVLGGIFAGAGIIKIQNGQDFSDSIETFKIFPREVINLIAVGLPPLEIMLGTMLVIGW